MRFMVRLEGQRRFVNLVFGTPLDLRGLLRWRPSAAARGEPQVRTRWSSLSATGWRMEN